MYNLPLLYGSQNYLHAVLATDLNNCKERCIFRRSIPCDEDVYHYCNSLIAQNNLQLPRDAHEGIDFYLQLRELMQNIRE